MFTIRPAIREDHWEIKKLIFAVRINPLGIDWRRFVVAMTENEDMVGCGQVRLHRDGSRELASIAVKAGWRNRGIASEMIRHLKAEYGPPLWLMCSSGMVAFYEKHGFKEVKSSEALPNNFKWLHLLDRLPQLIKSQSGRLAIMLWNKD